MSGNQLPTEPVEQEKQQVSNQHFISHQLAPTPAKGKSKANILPQTGNDLSNNSVLGFAFAALAGIFGLTGMKKKREKQRFSVIRKISSPLFRNSKYGELIYILIKQLRKEITY